MLKRGGQIFATIWLAPNELTLTFEEVKAQKSKSWWPYYKGSDSKFLNLGSHPIETITCYLNKTGFVVDMIDVLEIYSEYPTRDAILSTTTHMA